MRTYKPKKLINGYKLGCDDCKGKTFVAIPKWNGEPITVIYNNVTRIVGNNTLPVMQETFADKFGRDSTYTLSYFLWE